MKKKTDSKICDTCKVDFVINSEPDISYIITGSGHTAPRLYRILDSLKTSHTRRVFNCSVHLISKRRIGLTFLPQLLVNNSRGLQNPHFFKEDGYINLEFQAQQNGKVIKEWTSLTALGEDKSYLVLETKQLSNSTQTIPWKRVFYAGSFDLGINDSLNITVRNIQTKKIIKTILMLRPVDRATNFIYYQLPVSDTELSTNLQDILNTGFGKPTILHGNSLTVFEKDYGTIGILRFSYLSEKDSLEYSFEKKPLRWKTLKALDPRNGLFLILSNDLNAGRDQDIYLRYRHQPETIHKITVRVKQRPFQFPWARIAVISSVFLIVGGLAFYLRDKRNKNKLAALKLKSQDAETRLSLLSGQLNPHFLFNSLNAIQGTINCGDPDRANKYIGNVARFMRDVMDNGKKEFVSLQEELKIEEDYLKLEQERKAFSYTIVIVTDLEPMLIDFPPLLLQPVLENSIRHAFNTELPDPVISINISRDNTNLCVEVSDNGNTMWDTDKVLEGHGLLLTRKRIAVYNEKFESIAIRMQIKYHLKKGTVTTFTFQNWLA